MDLLSQYIENHIDQEDSILNELFRETHLKIVQPRMISGHQQGILLEIISKILQPVSILEIGTFTGYSAICLAKGLAPEGQLHTIEINDELTEFARKYFIKSNLQDKIIQHVGDALEVIQAIDTTFDLVFIDGDKRQYLQYYHAVFDKVNPNGVIIADNVLWSGKVITTPEENDFYTKGVIEFNDFVKDDSRVNKTILPLRDGIMIIRKK